MKKYRIIKVTSKSGDIEFLIQRKILNLFWSILSFSEWEITALVYKSVSDAQKAIDMEKAEQIISKEIIK